MNLRSRPLQQAPLMPRYPLYATPAGLHVHSLGSSPFARRYSGNHCCFLFLGVLRCFSSPGALLTAYRFSRRSLPTTEEGFPHSDTLGSTPAYGSPRHFGVRPVLLRHLAPRHPPCALPILSYSPSDVRRMAASAWAFIRSRTSTYAPSFTPCASLPSLHLVGDGGRSALFPGVSFAFFDPCDAGVLLVGQDPGPALLATCAAFPARPVLLS